MHLRLTISKFTNNILLFDIKSLIITIAIVISVIKNIQLLPQARSYGGNSVPKFVLCSPPGSTPKKELITFILSAIILRYPL